MVAKQVPLGKMAAGTTRETYYAGFPDGFLNKWIPSHRKLLAMERQSQATHKVYAQQRGEL